MTTETKTKKKPVFRIVIIDENKNSEFVTVAYPHKSGGGHNFKIKDQVYSAFLIKDKSEAETDDGGEAA